MIEKFEMTVLFLILKKLNDCFQTGLSAISTALAVFSPYEKSTYE